MDHTQTEKLQFICKEHPGYEIISIIVSDKVHSNKRLCCQKCMIYTYRGITTDQFILLEDLLLGKEQATAYFLPIKRRELDIIQEAIIKSLNNGYLREVEEFFSDLQKKINQKIHDKKKEALLKAEEKQSLIEDLRDSFNRSEKIRELQQILHSSFLNAEETPSISEKINDFLEKHKTFQNEAEKQYLNVCNTATQNSPQQQPNEENGQQPQENQEQQQATQNTMSNLGLENLTDLDFYSKFKNFRKKDFQIKVSPLEINITPVYDLTVQFVKHNNNDLVLGKNSEGQSTILNNGGQTANCRSDYTIRTEKTHVFTFQFSTKPSDYMRIGIAKKGEDPEDKLCQCFGWSNNFDLIIEKGENLSNLQNTNSIVKMEVNISQNILKFYDSELKNISKKKSTFNLDASGEYNIVVYFHSDLKIPITLTLISAELID